MDCSGPRDGGGFLAVLIAPRFGDPVMAAVRRYYLENLPSYILAAALIAQRFGDTEEGELIYLDSLP